MYRRSIAVWVLFLVTVLAFGEPRILVLGDSWAAGIFGFQAFPQVLERHGVTDVDVIGSKTALGGSRADQWAENHKGKLDALASELAENPSVDMVHVSIGGNDFLKFGLENDLSALSAAERAAEWDSICADIKTLLTFIQDQRPGIRILLSDYDFLSPETIREVVKLEFKGSPDAKAFNTYHLELALKKRALAASMDNVAYVHHFGLLQYYYGIDGVAEPKTVPFPGKRPDYEPFPGGTIEYGPSKEAMPDGVHPMPEGYVYIIENCYDQVYGEWLAAEVAGAVK